MIPKIELGQHPVVCCDVCDTPMRECMHGRIAAVGPDEPPSRATESTPLTRGDETLTRFTRQHAAIAATETQ